MALIINGKKLTEEAANAVNDKFDYDESPAETEIKEGTELGDSLNHLNDDSIEKGTRMSGIDLRSRLHHIESVSILAIDSLVVFRFLPVQCLGLTRQKKRLSVSIDGQGRKEIVDIVAGKREQDVKAAQGGGSLGERIKNIFRGGENGKET